MSRDALEALERARLEYRASFESTMKAHAELCDSVRRVSVALTARNEALAALIRTGRSLR